MDNGHTPMRGGAVRKGDRDKASLPLYPSWTLVQLEEIPKIMGILYSETDPESTSSSVSYPIDLLLRGADSTQAVCLDVGRTPREELSSQKDEGGQLYLRKELFTRLEGRFLL